MSADTQTYSPSKRIKALHRKQGSGLALKVFASQLKDAEGTKLADDWRANTAPPPGSQKGPKAAPVPAAKAPSKKR